LRHIEDNIFILLFFGFGASFVCLWKLLITLLNMLTSAHHRMLNMANSIKVNVPKNYCLC